MEEIFAKEDLVYLSPDSPNIIEEIDPTKTYVIGGLVDGSPKREVSLNRAAGIGCLTGRLPIKENMTRITPHGYNTILTLNQVYEILMRFHETKSWDVALKNSVPQRKGFVLNTEIGAGSEGSGSGKSSESAENGNSNGREMETGESGRDSVVDFSLMSAIDWLIDWLISRSCLRSIDWLIDWFLTHVFDRSIDWLIDWFLTHVFDRLIDWLIGFWRLDVFLPRAAWLFCLISGRIFQTVFQRKIMEMIHPFSAAASWDQISFRTVSSLCTLVEWSGWSRLVSGDTATMSMKKKFGH